MADYRNSNDKNNGYHGRTRLTHDYEDEFERDYQRIRQNTQERRRHSTAQQRVKEQARRRQAKRERELRAFRRRMIAILVAAAAVVAAGSIGWRIVRGAGNGASKGPTGEEVAVAAGSTAQPEESAAASELATEAEPLSEEQIAADRAAKHYSEAVATFWPYYTFHETADTREIPSIPSDEEAYRTKYHVTDEAAGSSTGTDRDEDSQNTSASSDESGNHSDADTSEAAGDTEAEKSNTSVTDAGVSEDDTNEDASHNNSDKSANPDAATDTTDEGAAGQDSDADASKTPDSQDGDSAADGNDSEDGSDSEDGGMATTSSGSEIPKEDMVGGDYVASYYAIVVDADNGDILAGKRMKDRIVPASMTKVMTLLVAVEQLGLSEDSAKLHDMVTLTREQEEFAYVNGSSAVCWMPGDTASVEDLMYGTILPSGADAALALAEHVSGTQEEFVKLMNAKAEELGISETTHFTNCVGNYDEDHYSTVYDMAVIMKAALENDLCRKVLAEHTWTTSPTSEHAEGITVSNWFLRRIEDKETPGTVLCAKTGFVNESGYCAVSYEECDDGRHLIVCTADTWGNWRCIGDHVALYNEYGQ